MNNHVETEEEIQEEMAELGVSNDETGPPQLFLSSSLVKVVAGVCVVLLVVGLITLVF